MITKYFTKISVKFNPFTAGAKPARLFLARIPTSLKAQCQVEYKVLTAGAKESPSVEVTFTDKNVMKADPETTNFVDLSNYFDSHSRKLAIKEAITDSVISVDDNKIARPVVMFAGKVAGQNGFYTVGVSLLSINRCARNVRSHGISPTMRVLHGQPWVVLWRWLWIPNVTGVTQEFTGIYGIRNRLSVTNGPSGSVDQPSTVLHLRDQILAEQTIGTLVTSNVPSTLKGNLVSRNKVSDQVQNTHHDMFGHRDDIGAGDFGNSQISLVGGIQVDVVRSNTGSNAYLQVLCLFNSFLGDVTGIKRSGDDHLSVLNLLFKAGVYTVFAMGRNQFVAIRLHQLSDA